MPQVEDWQITTDVPSGMYLLFTAVGRRRFNFPPALLLLHSMPAHVFVRASGRGRTVSRISAYLAWRAAVIISASSLPSSRATIAVAIEEIQGGIPLNDSCIFYPRLPTNGIEAS